MWVTYSYLLGENCPRFPYFSHKLPFHWRAKGGQFRNHTVRSSIHPRAVSCSTGCAIAYFLIVSANWPGTIVNVKELWWSHFGCPWFVLLRPRREWESRDSCVRSLSATTMSSKGWLGMIILRLTIGKVLLPILMFLMVLAFSRSSILGYASASSCARWY